MKNCISLASVCLLSLFASGTSLAQEPSAPPTARIAIGPGLPCPVIVVSCPTSIEVGKPLEFKVVMSNPKPAEPTYTWEVVGGVIAEGQGTAEIKVNVPTTPGPTVTANVSIGGLDLACSRTASASLSNCGMLQAPDPAGIVSNTKDEARPSVAAALSSPSPAAQNEPCPGISVSCPSDVEVGKPQVFKARVGDSNAKLSYIWEVVGGLLVEGQGTPEIKVSLTRRLNEGVTATLSVCGLDPACAKTASCSTVIRQGWISAERFDSYVAIQLNNEKPLLNLFATALKQRPGDKGYILGYGGSRSRSGAAQKAIDRAKQYLVNALGMDERRFITVIAGARKDPTVELWFVPIGAIPPATEPAVTPTKVAPTKSRQ